MDFFAAQAAARRRTRGFLAAYAVAVAVVVAAITLVVVALVGAAGNVPPDAPPSAYGGLAVVTALFVLGVIAVAAIHRTAQLSGGGGAAARALGGVRVTAEARDPLRRRLLNVVEEMAIASGVPVPEVYVLEQETAINAFAAGTTPADAAVAVTRGALERLTRAELSGVIGHEFSHVLNGDMRLNTRLAGPLFGLLVIAIAARHLLRGASRSRGKGSGPFVVAALAVMALGYVGVLVGRLLQAAICRQREFLADASSVQFTRDDAALRDALVRIARSGRGTRIANADGEDLAHAFVAAAYPRAFATHPPLAERIRRLDRGFDVRVLGQVEPEPGPETLLADAALDAGLGLEPPADALPLVAREAFPLDAARLPAQVGNPGLDDVAWAQALRAALPTGFDDLLARGATAAGVWLAVCLAADAAVRERQLALIERRLGAPYRPLVASLAERIGALPVTQRLPLLQRALPALATLPAGRGRLLAALTRESAAVDGRIDVFEYLLGVLAARYLDEQVDGPPPARRDTLADAADAAAVALATLAFHGAADESAARRAYEAGIAGLLPRERPAYRAPPADRWPAELDAALARLDRLQPAAKELLVEALGRAVAHDGRVTVREAELLRAACAAIHCPLPPLLAPLEPRAA